MDNFSLLGGILDDNGLSEVYLYKFRRRLEKTLSVTEFRSCIEDSSELEIISNHFQVLKRNAWYNWFPQYMCDEAHKLLSEESSELLYVLSETVISKQITTVWRGDKLGTRLLHLANSTIPSEYSILLFYVLYVIVCNLPVLRETYFFMEEKPTFVFELLYNSGVFDSSYPIYHILEKLIQVDKENQKRCQNESTFDWDLFLTNLLVKITAYFLVSFIIRLSIYHSSKEVPSSYVGLSSSPIVLQLIYYSLLSLVHQQDSHQQSSYNLVYLYCYTTLLSLNLHSCPLEMNVVSLTPFFNGKRCQNQTFLGQVLSLMTYLLYGDVHTGFYPVKGMSGESRFTTQLRCACLSVWEVSFHAFFKTNPVYETLKHLLELEDVFIKKNHYSYWLNALINRICNYVSSHMRDLLAYPCFTEPRVHKEYLNSPRNADEQDNFMSWFVLKKREEIACYIQEYLIPLGKMLIQNTGVVFRHCLPEGEREILTRKLIFSQLGVQCDEPESSDYHYCLERDFFKKQLTLEIYNITLSHYGQLMEALTGSSEPIPVDFFRSNGAVSRENSQDVIYHTGRTIVWSSQCLSPADGIVQFSLTSQSFPSQHITLGFAESRDSVFSKDNTNSHAFSVSMIIGPKQDEDNSKSTILITVDLLSGYFWAVDEKGELMDSVITDIPFKDMYLGIVIESDDQSTHSIQLTRVVPRASHSSEIVKYINFVNNLIQDCLKTEIGFFERALENVEYENKLRFYCKQMKYITTFYTLLRLHSIDTLFPLPLRIIDLIQSDLDMRKKLQEFYPGLFTVDKETITGYHEYCTTIRPYTITDKTVSPSPFVDDDLVNMTSLSILFGETIIANSNQSQRKFEGSTEGNRYSLFSSDKTRLLILFRGSLQSLYGLIFDTKTMNIRGFIYCKEKETFEGLQGLRSPTLFLDSLNYVLHSLVGNQLHAFYRINRVVPDCFSSCLFRNGMNMEFSHQVLTDILNGESALFFEETEKKCCDHNLLLDQSVQSLMEKSCASDLQIRAELQGRKYCLDLPDTEYELQLYQAVKLPPICSVTHPHHKVILPLYRIIMCVAAYHTNHLHCLLPSQNHSGEFPLTSEILSLYKQGAQFMTKLQVLRQQMNLSWDDFQFIHSFFFLIEKVNSSCLSWKECETVLLDFIGLKIDFSSVFESFYFIQKITLQTVLTFTYLTPSSFLYPPTQSVSILTLSCYDGYVIGWLENRIKDLSKEGVVSLFHAVYQSYCTLSILQFLLQHLSILLQGECSTDCLLSILRLFLSLSSNQHSLLLSNDQNHLIVELAFQSISMLAKAHEEYALIIGIPHFFHILLCYPNHDYRLYHLNSILCIYDHGSSTLQSFLLLAIHFLLNNWTSDEELKDTLYPILFCKRIPTELLNELEDKNDLLIAEVMKMDVENCYREYINLLLKKTERTSLRSIVLTLFTNPVTRDSIESIAIEALSKGEDCERVLPSLSFALTDVPIREEFWNSIIQYTLQYLHPCSLEFILFLVTTHSIPHSFFRESNSGLFSQLLSSLSGLPTYSSLYSMATKLIGYLLNHWEDDNNCLMLFHLAGISPWKYHSLIENNSAVFRSLKQSHEEGDWNEVFVYCIENHPPLSFVQQVVFSYLECHKDSSDSIVTELIEAYRDDSFDFIKFLVDVVIRSPTLLSFDYSNLKEQASEVISHLRYECVSDHEKLLLQLVLLFKQQAIQESTYEIHSAVGRSPYGYQIITEQPTVFLFQYNKKVGYLTLQESLLVLDYGPYSEYYMLYFEEDGSFSSSDVLTGIYDKATGKMEIELKLNNEIMRVIATNIKELWKSSFMIHDGVAKKQGWLEYTLDDLAHGLLVFSMNVSDLLTPFILTITQCNQNQLKFIPMGSISYKKRMIAYGEAAEQNDCYTIILDESRSMFSVFLEGQRMSNNYVEYFGIPAWKEAFVYRNGEMERTLAVAKKNDLGSVFTFMREVTSTEMIEVLSSILYCVNCFIQGENLPQSFLQQAYYQTVKMISNEYRLFFSRVPQLLVELNVSERKMKSLYPQLSPGQEFIHPTTKTTIRLVGLQNHSVYYVPVNENVFESGREEFLYVNEISEEWCQKYHGPESHEEEFVWSIDFAEFCDLLSTNHSLDNQIIQYLNQVCYEIGDAVWNLPIASLSFSGISAPLSLLQAHTGLLVSLNLQLLSLLPYISCSQSSQLIQSFKPYLFTTTKLFIHSFFVKISQIPVEPSFDTQRLPSSFQSFHINRLLARRDHLLEVTRFEDRFASSVTSQFIHQLDKLTLKDFYSIYIHRSNGGQKRLFHVIFDGEGGLDNGGLYRDLFHTFVQEVTDVELFPFFVHTPNYQNNHGNDDLIFNEAIPSSLLPVLKEIGRIIGVALLSGIQLDFFFSPLVWKLLNREEVSIEDCKCFDTGFYQFVRTMKQSSRIEFESVFEDQKWYYYSLQGVLLTSSTHSPFTHVCYDNRDEFCQWVMRAYLQKQKEYALMIREGIESVYLALRDDLLDHNELMELVIGKQDVNVDILKTNTKYEGYDVHDSIIEWFWEVIEEMKPSQRIQFLQFTTARSRLPTLNNQLALSFQIAKVHKKENADSFFPVAHTCFNGLDLPSYSSKAVLQERLLYAIQNTVSIDGDTLQHNDIDWE